MKKKTPKFTNFKKRKWMINQNMNLNFVTDLNHQNNTDGYQ
jgi:hypothetical protein